MRRSWRTSIVPRSAVARSAASAFPARASTTTLTASVFDCWVPLFISPLRRPFSTLGCPPSFAGEFFSGVSAATTPPETQLPRVRVLRVQRRQYTWSSFLASYCQIPRWLERISWESDELTLHVLGGWCAVVDSSLLDRSVPTVSSILMAREKAAARMQQLIEPIHSDRLRTWSNRALRKSDILRAPYSLFT